MTLELSCQVASNSPQATLSWRLLKSVAASSCARSCKASVKPVDRIGSPHVLPWHSHAAHGIGTYPSSCYDSMAYREAPSQTSKTLICKTIVSLRLPVCVPLPRMSSLELYTEIHSRETICGEQAGQYHSSWQDYRAFSLELERNFGYAVNPAAASATSCETSFLLHQNPVSVDMFNPSRVSQELTVMGLHR